MFITIITVTCRTVYNGVLKNHLQAYFQWLYACTTVTVIHVEIFSSFLQYVKLWNYIYTADTSVI